MNVTIIGPENAGKSTLARMFAKRTKGKRPVYMFGEIKSEFPTITLEQFGYFKNCVVIVDDANALLDQYELSRKNSPIRKPIILHRHWNRLNIFIFHSIDDAVKKIFRQSKFIYISTMYQEDSLKKPRSLKGITPNEVGRKGFTFLEYKRY